MSGRAALEAWFETRGWRAFEFQRRVWESAASGRSGLLHSATGSGKTYAVFGGPVSGSLDDPGERGTLKVVWITPLRALAADTLEALQTAVEGTGSPWKCAIRTGDTSTSERQKQQRTMPDVLVTTPESLTLLLTREDSAVRFADLRSVVVDEWHELIGSKRGVQTELALARLRRHRPGVPTWGISATLGNTEEAMTCLLGPGVGGELVRGEAAEPVVIDTLVPPNIQRFPWAGHFGTRMVKPVIEAIEEGETCLVFTNTRSQSEIWFQQILDEKPGWAGKIALHHGSLSREVRDDVEEGLKSGRLRAVVCTSSLDLGVDFSPVDRVIQIGSPKGVARLLQRAGRSGHRPGAVSRVTCVPTHAFELVDIAAARKAALEGRIEGREGVRRPLDVLAQHLVSMALAGGFRREEMLAELRTTASFEDLSEAEFDWCLDFVVRGGSSLRAYPEYHRVVEREGVFRVEHDELAQRHRMSIGTITSDAAIQVKTLTGGKLGTVEESFLSRLKPGEIFLFAGRALKFVRIKEMTAFVSPAKGSPGGVPRWAGGRLPLSNELSQAIRERLDEAQDGELEGPEMQALAPILELQARWSAIPGQQELLIEAVEDREGHHLFFYPVEGRLVHEGLAAICAYRLSRLRPITFTLACNDYGFELLSPEPVDVRAALDAGLLSPEGLGEDVVASLNEVEMAKRQFREIARIAGLVFQGFPGMNKSAKQVQATSGLFFDVFSRYDPENLLLAQAHREVLDRQLEASRLYRVLQHLATADWRITRPPRPTPMSFPILVDRLRETLTSESLSAQLERMTLRLEEEAG